MKIDSTINKILYVPFNEDYSVDISIKRLLTEEEFFKECFYMPDFEEEIKEIVEKTEDEIKAFEIDLTREELLEKYRQNKREKEAFFNWINNNQNDIYCIKGDAGTGKTTFVHYLKNVYINTLIEWDIVDMTKSLEAVKILNNQLNIPRFSNIYFKSISVLIKKMLESLFKSCENTAKIDHKKSSECIERVLENYNQFDGYYPVRFVDDFFHGLKSIDKSGTDNKSYVERCGNFIFDYLKKFLKDNKNEKEEIFSNILELYVYFICCENPQKRYFIAFDNLEKFIGTYEIYDKQLIDFVSKTRRIQKTLSENNTYLASRFQVTIFMRNTSTRMFTPQQIAEIFPHIVDLSEWFQSAKIIQKKIDWYKTNNISVDDSERLLDIINDIGYGNNDDFRGLRSKLNMLFNNDKRVIVNILTNVLDNAANKNYLNIYDAFRKNIYDIENSYAKFAKRTIAFRLVLNELRKDGFFSNIAVEHEEKDKTSLGYARKILTILYEHKQTYDDGYMRFDEIIVKLDNREVNAVDRYFIRYNSKKREVISKVLFYMNYYDGRTNNWLQFIDIQYNINQNQTRIKTYSELSRLIDNNHDNINIRITSAGIAYLFYVVYSYEYFACKSINIAPKECLTKDGNLPPLLCAIPNKEEILTKPENVLCIKILKFVSNEAAKCIERMKEDKKKNEKTIPFRKKAQDRYMEHSDRIINSHIGFIDNYLQCIKQLYRRELRNNRVFWERFQLFEREIEKIRGVYFKWK